MAYQQPDFRNPTTDPRVGVQIENVRNVLVIVAPVPPAKYVQPGGVDKPAPPVSGQLDNTPLGRSKITRPDGSTAST